ALLLATGKLVRRFMQLIFHFVPQRRVAQALLNGVGDRPFDAIYAQSVSHIIKDRFWKRIRALEYHAHPASKRGYILSENILTIDKNFTFEAGAAHRLVHAIQSAQ